MKVTIEIHKFLSAREIINDYELHKEYFSDVHNAQGIYFHLYGASTIPFYIGISDHMLRRNRDHIALYRKDYDEIGARYWLAKEPDDLKDAKCFINYTKEQESKFFSPKRSDDIVGRDEVIIKLLNNMKVLFARVIPENKSGDNIRWIIEVAERQMQDNLIKNCKIEKSWIGRTGSNKGGGDSEDIYELSIKYASSDIPRLNEKELTIQKEQ